METCIYVFSGTGTSLAAAQHICDSLGNAEIKMIPSTLRNAAGNEIKTDAATVGFVFPNYFGGVPEIVLRFIRTLNLDTANYIFAIVTGGGGRGYSLKFMEQALKKKGKKLNYGKSVIGTSNYIVEWYYKLIFKAGKQQRKALHQLEQKTKRFAQDITCGKEEVEKSQFVSYKMSLLLSPKAIVKDTRPWDKDFSVDQNCIGCSICEKVCQVKNIKLNNGKPAFQHNCQRCMACIQYCPQHAIGLNGKPLVKPRYFHPNYPANEMIHFTK